MLSLRLKVPYSMLYYSDYKNFKYLSALPVWRINGPFLLCLCTTVSGGSLKRIFEKKTWAMGVG